MRIGTRGSALALWQARAVARLIAEAGGPQCEIVVIRTTGDEAAGSANPNIKATFVKEIEDALLNERIDLGVHSGKDLPAVLPKGLTITAALTREDPRDALLVSHSAAAGDLSAITANLGPRPRIGTSSVRRAAALRAIFPDATLIPIRGNVDTRLRKLDAGECDVLVLAAAGLIRLGLTERISTLLPIDVCVPAPAQGIVAIETAATPDVERVVAAISDADAMTMLTAERAVVRALGGGCQMPLGALASIDGEDARIDGVVLSVDGRRTIRASSRGHRAEAVAVGEQLAQVLLDRGAAALLDRR